MKWIKRCSLNRYGIGKKKKKYKDHQNIISINIKFLERDRPKLDVNCVALEN